MPNAELAIVPAAKLRNYLLDPRHPVGGPKAAVFKALGFRRRTWRDLRLALKEAARVGAVRKVTHTDWGRKYEVRGILQGANGRKISFRVDLDDSDWREHSAVYHRLSRRLMSFKELDPVVLLRDVPDHGLRAGDAGTVVHVHSDAAVEVEFVRFSGQTHAVVTMNVTDLRSASDADVIAARSTVHD